MPYLPKTFSLKTTGQQFYEAVEDGLRQIKQLQAKLETAKQNAIGPALEQALKDFRAEMDTLKAAKTAKFEEIKKSAHESIRRPMVNAKPEDVVPNDLMRLDDKFFAPDQEAFDTLVEKHKDNFAMTNALCKYAIDHLDDIGFLRPPTIDEMDTLVDFAAGLCRDTISSEKADGDFAWAITVSADYGAINRLLNDHLTRDYDLKD